MADFEGKDSTRSASDSLVSALRRVLRPLVRLLIDRSITFPEAAAVLRALYVETAVEHFPVDGRPQTDSRVTLLTGVHRKDVKRLRAERHAEPRPPRSTSLGPQLIARWLSVPAYQDDAGNPAPLPRSADADAISFDTLVRSLSTDIRPRVVLDEWLRLGLVHVDDQERVVLNVQGFVPAPGSEEMTYFFGRNLHDHVAAAVANMLGDGTPFLERGVNYNNLGPDAVAELKALSERRGMELLRELNARALELQQRDAGRPDANQRVNVGLYVFTEPQPPAKNGEPEE